MKISHLVFAFLIVFGVSLFGFHISTFGLAATATVADATIFFIITVCIFRLAPISINYITVFSLLLALSILISGTLNTALDDQFSTTNFIGNFMKVGMIICMTLFLPKFIEQLGTRNLSIAVIWIMRISCLCIFADAAGWWPETFTPRNLSSETFQNLSRPTGIFREPSWFGIYSVLSLFLLMQLEKLTGKPYIKFLDLLIIAIALMVTTTITGLIFHLLFSLFFIALKRPNIRVKGAIIGLAATLGILIVIVTPVHQLIGLEKGLTQITDRAEKLRPGSVTDNSALLRIVGSWRASTYTLIDRPLLGSGLGGENQSQAFDRFVEKFNADPNLTGFNTLPSAILQANGLLGLSIYGMMLLVMVVKPSSRWVGISIILVGTGYGGAYETILWWFIVIGGTLRKDINDDSKSYSIATSSKAIPS